MAAFGFALAICLFFAFRSPESPQKEKEGLEHCMLTTVESIVPGGLGRSRLFISYSGGKLEEEKIENLYSMVGINMNNINDNDATVIQKIDMLTNEGWVLDHVSTGVQSPAIGANGSKGEGIFLTRYLFTR